MHIHNVYNPSPAAVTTDNPSRLNQARGLIQAPGEHILVGDFNLHHPNWNNPGRFTYHSEADELIEATTSAGMELLLPEGAVTWCSRGHESAIDLVFATLGLADCVLGCGVREDLQHGSDYTPIVTELDLGTEEQAKPQRYAWKTADGEEVRKGAQALNGALPATPLTTTLQVDDFLLRLQEGMVEIRDLTVPWAKPPGKGKSYWTPECTKAVRRAKDAIAKTKGSRGTASEQQRTTAIRDRNRVITKAKALAFRRAVHEAGESPKGVWQLAKWARENSMEAKPLPKFPALKQAADRQMATTFKEKVSVLRETFFPPPPQADLADIQDANYPDPLSTADMVSKEEVWKAIFRPKEDKALGVNGFPNRFLRVITEKLIGKITHLFQACLRLRYHPREFKKANTVVLKKPRKADYSEPKAYRPIALLSTLGKALEAVIAKRLSDYTERHGLFPTEQMGARRRRSTETALETIVDAVHTVWDCGKDKVASLLSLDVAGAFDNVSHRRLIHNLRMKGVPRLIVAWTESFLRERATSITLGRRTSSMEEVETGIPQGLPVSPVLFLFFNSPLIEGCSRLRLQVQTGGFVDDIHLLAYGTSTEATCRTLALAHQECLRWASTHGASFAPAKYELVHLTRCPRRFDMTASVDLGSTITRPQTSIRVLGLHIDGKLRWGPHIQKVKAKMAAQELSLSIVAASTWGATLNKAKQVYSAVVRPAMTYAAAVWHSPRALRGATRAHVRSLGVIQNRCIRRVLGAYKATSVRELEVESGIAPMQVTLDQTVLRYQALQGIHPATKAGNARIRRKLHKRQGRPRTVAESPAEGKREWALRALRMNNWDELRKEDDTPKKQQVRKEVRAW